MPPYADSVSIRCRQALTEKIADQIQIIALWRRLDYLDVGDGGNPYLLRKSLPTSTDSLLANANDVYLLVDQFHGGRVCTSDDCFDSSANIGEVEMCTSISVKAH